VYASAPDSANATTSLTNRYRFRIILSACEPAQAPAPACAQQLVHQFEHHPMGRHYRGAFESSPPAARDHPDKAAGERAFQNKVA
jgi:hypothetical protein